MSTNMEAITFSPAQVHIFNLVSHIKSDAALEQLRQQLAAFYQFDEKRMKELRGSHFRTPYND